MKRMGTETKVGIFVLLGIIALVYMAVRVGKFQLGKEAGYRVYILFDSAAGVVRNSPVRIAGVHVGKVERISLEMGKAKVALRIPPGVHLYEDARAYLRSEGLLGERYIDIFPGSEEKPRLKEEGLIQQGAPPVSIEQVLSRLSGIGEDFEAVLQPLGQLLKGIDPEKVRHLVSNFETLSRDFPHLMVDARETLRNIRNISAKVERGEGILGKLISDDEAYRDAGGTIVALKEIVEKVQRGEGTLGKLINDEEVYQGMRETLVVLRDVAEKVQRGEGTLGKLVNDDEAYQDVRKTLVAMRDVAEKVQRGEGTLGKLINDDEAYQDAKVTLANLRRASERLDRGEGVLGRLITDEELGRDVENTIRKVEKAAEGAREQQPVTALGILLGLIF
ncbi:MAG: MCE family protein [Proteobacteria bacterium]|nr:MCE family protein [Pseudomonadota bacterium]